MAPPRIQAKKSNENNQLVAFIITRLSTANCIIVNNAMIIINFLSDLTYHLRRPMGQLQRPLQAESSASRRTFQPSFIIDSLPLCPCFFVVSIQEISSSYKWVIVGEGNLLRRLLRGHAETTRQEILCFIFYLLSPMAMGILRVLLHASALADSLGLSIALLIVSQSLCSQLMLWFICTAGTCPIHLLLRLLGLSLHQPKLNAYINYF